MKKFILFILLAVTSQVIQAYDFEDFGMYYNIISSSQKTCGLAHVENGIVSLNNGKISIPETVNFEGNDYTVTQIQSMAFHNLTTLTSIEMPSTIESIGFSAFSGCTSLTDFNIPSHIKSIGDYAFQSCLRLENIVIDNAETSLSLGLKVFKDTPVKHAYIGRSFTAKSDKYGYAESVIFANYTDITSIEFGENVTSIPEYAFYGCQFTELILPDNLEVIPSDAFESCWSLETLVLPKHLKRILSAAFRGCGKLNHIVFPSTLEYIGWDGFMDFNGMTLDLSGTSVSFIGSGAFRSCANLTEIILPESLVEIEPTAFQSAQIVSIKFPPSVKTIGSIAFNLCDKLTSVYCESITPPTSVEDTFDTNTYENATLYVPIGCSNAYSRSGAWKYFKSIKETDYSGIDSINIDDDKPLRYIDIFGNPINTPGADKLIKQTNETNLFIVI